MSCRHGIGKRVVGRTAHDLSFATSSAIRRSGTRFRSSVVRGRICRTQQDCSRTGALAGIGASFPRDGDSSLSNRAGVPDEHPSSLRKFQSKHLHCSRPKRCKSRGAGSGEGIPAGKRPNSPTFKTGVGIQGMKERMAQLGGHFEIRSGKNGTVVVATLPVTRTSGTAPNGLAS